MCFFGGVVSVEAIGGICRLGFACFCFCDEGLGYKNLLVYVFLVFCEMV